MKSYIALFLVGFLSDFVLNYLSRQEYSPVGITSLLEYFEDEGDLLAAVKAGLTTLICGRISDIISPPGLYNKILTAFLVGYVADWVIYKCNTFGEKLNKYYQTLGAGVWGGAAIAFAVLATLFINELKIG